MSDNDQNRGETHERLIEKGIEPARYVPAPQPPEPVKDSGIGTSAAEGE